MSTKRALSLDRTVERSFAVGYDRVIGVDEAGKLEDFVLFWYVFMKCVVSQDGDHLLGL